MFKINPGEGINETHYPEDPSKKKKVIKGEPTSSTREGQDQYDKSGLLEKNSCSTYSRKDVENKTNEEPEINPEDEQ